MNENPPEPSLGDKAGLSEGDAQALLVLAKKALLQGINGPALFAFGNYIPESATSSIAIDAMPEPPGKNSKSPPIATTSRSIR